MSGPWSALFIPATVEMMPLCGQSRVSHQDPSGGMMIKTGMNSVNINSERVSTGLGYRFIQRNTALQPNGGLDVFSSVAMVSDIWRAGATRSDESADR